MSFKPDKTKFSDEEMKQLAAGRLSMLKEGTYFHPHYLNNLLELAGAITFDVYNLNINDPTLKLNGEQLLYQQNIIDGVLNLKRSND